MPKYRLNALGDTEFESLAQALLKRVIGAGTLTFGAGQDGSREATYEGTAPYPSQSEQWSGRWIFQVKFHDTELIGVGRARTKIIAEMGNELDKLINKYKRKFDNYILITNVPLSGVHQSGTLDRIEREVFQVYRPRVPHLAVWGANEVNPLLDLYPEVRTAYLPLLVTGDIITQLLNLAEQPRSDRATTIDLFLRTAITREENAQLDQAGDVSEESIPLQKIFFDLDAYIPGATREAIERLRKMPGSHSLPYGEDAHTPIVKFLTQTTADRTVLVGGPGEGKSTIGQYLAQLHRATLLGKQDEIALSIDYVPELPRLPFRIILRDFAQWLADRASDSSDSGNLDAYITEQVERLSARDFSEKDLHEVLKSDPTLLVLDGLDEVTDAVVRKRLISRLLEFIDRCQNSLKCDLQVVATTRPTGYGDQFDPKTFIHFRLHKLQGHQVRDYAAKWAVARMLDDAKATRLRQTIDECLTDHQISLLMNTPLQVTILMLIINSGGTPPRQREALFNEYLEVIYKREKAKGLGIVKSEKELLIGLHRFVGFLLHEEATKAKTSAATLARQEYDGVVIDYLRRHDPYSPEEHIRAEWHAITVDAGERLVLIVESPANVFGFELRSIQEFFAACFLLDTASGTTQRYERFGYIAKLPHWRNVALFFAGRAGRTHPGEAAYIVEACRDVDRSGIDLFVKRGAEVALELAADRALGPNRILQRSLLEHGLGLFDARISFRALRSNIDLIKRLPFEDLRDHVLPVLEQRLPTLGLVAVSNACQLLSAVAPASPLLRTCLLRLIREAGEDFAWEVLRITSGTEISSELRIEVIRALLAAGASPRGIAEGLAAATWPSICSIARDLDGSRISDDLVREFASATVCGTSYLTRTSADASLQPTDETPLTALLRSARVVGALGATLRATSVEPVMAPKRNLAQRERYAGELPERVRSGDFDVYPLLDESSWMLWLAHLSVGDVSESSWARFVKWLSTHSLSDEVQQWWRYRSRAISPLCSAIGADFSLPAVKQLGEVAVALGGLRGFTEWLRRLGELERVLSKYPPALRALLILFGPGALPAEQQISVVNEMSQLFPERLQPIALDSLARLREETRLTMEDIERLSQWFVKLDALSPWRRSVSAYRAINPIRRLGSIMSEPAGILLDMLSASMLADIAAAMAGWDDGNLDALRTILRRPAVYCNATDVAEAHIGAPSSKLRHALISFAELSMDADPNIRKGACAVMISLCGSAMDDEVGRAAIRSRTIDVAQSKLLASAEEIERIAGIALYAVRPPRSAADWGCITKLLEEATDEEARELWNWVLSAGAEVANEPGRWVREIGGILQGGVDGEIRFVLSDVVRDLLPGQSQSLATVADNLGLQVITA